MHRMRGRVPRLIVACCVMFGLTIGALAEEAGVVTGRVLGPEGAVMPGVAVRLANSLTGFSATIVTGPHGAFRFANVPFNPYELSVHVEGYQPLRQPIEVRSMVPEPITLRLELAKYGAAVTVSGETSPVQLETDTSTSHVDIDKSYIQRVPATVPSRAMEQIITSTPGFAKDENGRFHFQGAHSQSEYVVDGQIISDQTGVTFSDSIDPGIAQSIEVIYGNVPAEYGEKIGAVINLTTRSGLGGAAVHGDLYTGASRFSTYDVGGSLGFGTDNFGVFASLDGSKSDRFLDPVNFDNLHNHGDEARGFLRLDWAADQSDSFRFTTLAGRTNRDVPNTYTQQAAGQDQTIETRDENYNLGWQRVLSPLAVLDVDGFARRSSFRLYPSPFDTPVQASSRRSLDNYGIAPSITWASGVHEVKVGGEIKRFPIDERFSFGLTSSWLNDPASLDYNPDLAPYDLTRGGSLFSFHGRHTGTYYALYAQDTIRLGNFTANVGLRYDHNNLPVTDAQLEPRIGAVYYVKETGTAFRVSYNRVLYTPEYENILFSIAPQVAALAPPAIKASRRLGGGWLLVHSERQNAYTFGAQQALGSFARVDIDFWKRQVRNAGDQDQFFNTGIVFPLAFSRGDLHGWDVRLDLAEIGGLRGFLSVGHTRAIYVAPPVGGLFLDPSVLGSLTSGPFVIDHDQDLQLQGGLMYDLGTTGMWLGTNVRYDSGLVSGAAPENLVGDPDNGWAAKYIQVTSNTNLNPNRIRPRTIWDFSFGADLKRLHLPVSLQVDILNAFDVKGVYNILSVFGGTHVIPPRTVSARLRYDF